jgi:hypothetical protein
MGWLRLPMRIIVCEWAGMDEYELPAIIQLSEAPGWPWHSHYYQ